MIRSRYMLSGMIFLAVFGLLFLTLEKTGLTQILGVPNITENEVITPPGSASFGRDANGFGPSIDTSGDTIVFGSAGEAVERPEGGFYDRAGRVHIYQKDADGNLFFYQRIQASDPESGAYFGKDVSIYGDRLVVGTNFGFGRIGKAYLFEKNQFGFWKEVEIITASDGVEDDNFGVCVSVYEDTVLIGANFADAEEFLMAGAAYIYERDGDGNWNETIFERVDPGDQDFFGFRCALSGDYALVGAPAANEFRGYADFYKKDESGNWNHEQRAIRNEGEVWDVFGWDVEIDEDTAIIGAPQAYKDPADITGILGIGTAFVYEKDSSGTWNGTELRLANNLESYYGSAVEISSTGVLIGAYGSENENGSDGKMYEYEKDSNGRWTLTKVFLPSIEDVDNLGNRVSSIGDTYLASARAASNIGPYYVYVFKVEEETSNIALMNLDPAPIAGLYSTSTATDATVNSEVVFIRGVRAREVTDDRICPGLQTGIGNYKIIDTVQSDDIGGASAEFRVPLSWEVGKPFYMQAVDVATCTASSVVMETVQPPDGPTFVLNSLNPAPVAGLSSTSTAEDTTPNSEVVFIRGNTARISSDDRICPGLQIGVNNYRIIDTVESDDTGVASADFRVPVSWEDGKTFYMQAVDVSTCSASNVVEETVVPPNEPTFVLNLLDPAPVAGLFSVSTATEATANSEIVFIRGNRAGNFSDNRICPGLQTGIKNYKIIDTVQSDSAGASFADFRVPLSWDAGKVFYMQAVDISDCSVSNVVEETVIPPDEPTFVLNPLTPSPVAGLVSELTAADTTENSEVVFIRGNTTRIFSDDRICPGLQTGILNYRIIDTVQSDATGAAFYNYLLLSGLAGKEHSFQAVDVSTCSVSNVITEFIEAPPEGALVFSGYEQIGANTFEYTIENVTPGRQVAVFRGFNLGIDTNFICEDVDLDLIVDNVEPTLTADENGVAKGQLQAFGIPGGIPLFYFQALDIDTCRKSNVEDFGIDE